MSVAVAREARVTLFPRQRRFVTSTAAYPAYIGGIGSGKSYAGAAKVLTRIGAKGVGTIYAPTYAMLRDATRRTLLDLLTLHDVPHTLHKSENSILIHATGHEILCRSLDNPDGLRGPNLEWAWVDEAAYVSREAWQIVKGRVRTGPQPQAWVTSTPKGRNWLWEEWERDATGSELDPVHPLYRVRTSENPELPAGFADGIGYTGAFAAQELGGEFVAFEGLVYASFARAHHVRRTDVTDWRTVLAVDVGTRNPTAILTVHQAGDERIHVSAEVYRRNMSAGEIVEAIRAAADASGAEAIVLDPSAAGYILELQRAGYPAVKGDNAVVEGIGRVTTALATGLTVDPACVHLIGEFDAYRYPDGARGETDKPVKESDHALDALRYAVMHLSAPALSGRLFL